MARRPEEVVKFFANFLDDETLRMRLEELKGILLYLGVRRTGKALN